MWQTALICDEDLTGLISHFNHEKEIDFLIPTHEEGWPKSVLGRSVCRMAA